MVVKEAVAAIQVRYEGDLTSMVVLVEISDWMLDILRKVEQTGFPEGLGMRYERKERYFQVFSLSIWKV